MSTISRPVSRTVTVDHGGNAGGCIVVEPADHVLVQVVVIRVVEWPSR